MSDRDNTISRVFLLIAGVMEILVVLTLVANFGWTHIVTISSYVLTAVIAYVISLLWKE
jgi:hypothetical protein